MTYLSRRVAEELSHGEATKGSNRISHIVLLLVNSAIGLYVLPRILGDNMSTLRRNIQFRRIRDSNLFLEAVAPELRTGRLPPNSWDPCMDEWLLGRMLGSYTSESFETCLVKRFSEESDVALDLGAHVGYYTLLLSAAAKRVYAFEPDPINFGFLRYNVIRNGLRNVAVERKAVSDQNRKSRLYISSQEDGSHNLWSAERRRGPEVDVVRLDDYFEGTENSVSFVKMDIEGSEYRALVGMNRLIEESRNLILVTEFNPSLLTRAGVNPADYLKLLLNYNFRLSEIDEAHRRMIPLQESRFDELRDTSKLINIFCRRQE